MNIDRDRHEWARYLHRVPRTLVMGDPQGPFDKLLEVLGRHGVLDGDRLAKDVVLVSIGDHFDYDLRDWQTAGYGVKDVQAAFRRRRGPAGER